jgi:hypothetical protein
MRYDKPEVVKVANAVYAIQGEVKSGNPLDSETQQSHPSIGAYEADE